jgi:hypothetical protein
VVWPCKKPFGPIRLGSLFAPGRQVPSGTEPTPTTRGRSRGIRHLDWLKWTDRVRKVALLLFHPSQPSQKASLCLKGQVPRNYTRDLLGPGSMIRDLCICQVLGCSFSFLPPLSRVCDIGVRFAPLLLRSSGILRAA